MREKNTIRHFRPGDEEALVSLWERAYASYAGFVPRTLEYWCWCILDRPGISSQDIIIIEDKDILGYGVLGPEGNVLEFAIDPLLTRKKREKIAGFLILALEDRSRTRGDEAIRFVMPYGDTTIKRVLRRHDYLGSSGQVYHINIINLEGLLERILSYRRDRIPNNWSPTFTLMVKANPSSTLSQGNFLIRFVTPMVVEKNPVDLSSDVTVATDISMLTKIIFGQITLENALAAGRLSFTPGNALEDLKMLIGLLTIDSPWYIPSADLW